MGPFTKRRVTAAPRWSASAADVTAAPARDVNDDGCAGDWAYEAWFNGPHGSMITVSFYACYGAAEGTYSLGYRYQYWPGCEYSQQMAAGWSYVGYGCADENFTGCESLDEASKYALGAAHTVCCSDGSEGQLRQALAEVFAWDGVPF